MTEVLLLALMLLATGARPDTFAVQAELQGLYDEINDATLQFATASDVDLFHDVMYTRDWVFIDPMGHAQSWPQVRERAIQALSAPRPDELTQPIQKLVVEPDGVTVVVDLITVNTIVDHEGRYGRPSASHTLTETTVFRDRWVRVLDAWKLKSREQMSGPTVIVDKPE